METVYISNIPVGNDNKPVFVAEVGAFFNKEINKAIDFLKKAVDAGVPVFKTEILHDENVVLKSADINVKYNHFSGSKIEDYRKFIERKVVKLSDYEKLFKEAKKQNMPIIATVFDEIGIEFLKNNGGDAIKISRNNLNNIPLLQKSADSGLPIILDTGEILLSEISKSIELLKKKDCKIIVNHHPGHNPSKAEDHNMNLISTYKSMFGIPIGLSCHYEGYEMIYVAIACGANLIEKGVVDDPTKEEADIISAMPFEDLTNLLKKIEDCWVSLGTGVQKKFSNRDLSTRTGMFAKRNLKKGEKINQEVIGFAWPPNGISPEYWEIIKDWVISDDINKGDPITFKFISPKK